MNRFSLTAQFIKFRQTETMNKLIFCLLLGSLTSALAGQSKILESLSMDSKVLDYDVEYSVYLPEDYATSERSYPVVYLLHGYTDDETG